MQIYFHFFYFKYRLYLQEEKKNEMIKSRFFKRNRDFKLMQKQYK